MEDNEREGNPIYKEGEIEIRTFPNDYEAHSVWIGKNYFLFQRGILQEYAEKTLVAEKRMPSNLEQHLRNYNHNITVVLKEIGISPEAFALVLARARIKELDDQVISLYSEIRDLKETK